MKIYHSISQFEPVSNLILTIGMYDGVHLGHQSIIQSLNRLAKTKNGCSGLLTFTPHPRLVLQKDTDLKLLTPAEESWQRLKDLSLDHLIIHPFTYDFSRLTSVEFVRDLLVNQLKISTLVVGYDHQFGRNREGGFEQLQELAELYEFNLVKMDAIGEHDKPISSTKIRMALEEGNIDEANEMLGYNYLMKGTVIRGDGIGRKLGFPTMNLEVNPLKLIPQKGVYGVKVKLNKGDYYGLLNIGTRPTIDGFNKRIELYVLDYSGNYYDNELELSFLTRIRNEMKFDDLTQLKQQITKDKGYFMLFLQNAAK